MSNISGNAFGAAAAYQQNNAWWNKNSRRGDAAKTAEARREERTAKAEGKEVGKTDSTGKSHAVTETSAAAGAEKVTAYNNVKTSVWSNKGSYDVPVPSYSKDYGTVIGDVSLSKEASDYYNKLKSKFGDMEFVLVSKDQKAAVQANVSKYGNAKKPVVLIDDEKLERMAADKDFREKYEGIIAMAQNQLASMKNDLSSSGAAIKNFGMSVNSDGSTDYFAVMEKSNKAQAERIEKKREERIKEKKDAKKLEHKKEVKKAQEKKAEAKKEHKKAEEKKAEARKEQRKVEEKKAESIEFSSSSLEDLVSAVRSSAYTQSLGSVQTDAEKVVGQSIDFKG